MQGAWHVTQWVIDLIGPFLVAYGGYKFLVVAVGYFTKWVEDEALVNITDKFSQVLLEEYCVSLWNPFQDSLS